MFWLIKKYTRGVEDELAYYVICDFDILLWVLNKSTLEGHCFMYSS